MSLFGLHSIGSQLNDGVAVAGEPKLYVPPRSNRRSRRRSSRAPASATPSNAAAQDSARGSLLSRPYLFGSRVAWAALDFAVALFCGGVAISIHASDHGLLASSIPIRMMGLLPLIYGTLFAFCVAGLSRVLGLHSFKETRAASVELLLIAQSVVLAAFGIYGALHFYRLTAVTREALPIEVLSTCAAMFLCRTLFR